MNKSSIRRQITLNSRRDAGNRAGVNINNIRDAHIKHLKEEKYLRSMYRRVSHFTSNAPKVTFT